VAVDLLVAVDLPVAVDLKSNSQTESA